MIPIDSDLEAAIVKRLQNNKRGETVEQLSQETKKAEGTILTVLYALQKENRVARSETGVWTMVRTEGPLGG